MNERELLLNGAKDFSIELDEEGINKFELYSRLLHEWNQKMNLTAINEKKDIVIKHFLDSLSIEPFIKAHIKQLKENKNPRLIDIGTGAGFPGIPIGIVEDNLEITLLESREKKIEFLRHIIKNIGLKLVYALWNRAEEAGRKTEHREQYDIAVARAVAKMPVLLEYCMPFVKTGGIFISMKGKEINGIEKANKTVKILGGEVEDIKTIELPHSDIKRNIIIIKKYRQIPSKYPRKAGKPLKKPLV